MDKTLTNYELKQITESFFKEKGTFSIDNVIGLMKKAYESGYAKGNLDGKYQNSLPTIKPLSPSDFNFNSEWYKTPVAPLNATTLEEALKKCQL